MKRGFWVYLTLAAVWFLLLIWQWGEHKRVVNAARATLVDRARAITTTVGLVIRSERRGRGIVPQIRLELALNELIKPGELEFIALRNSSNHVVVKAGAAPGGDEERAVMGEVTWTQHAMVLANPVDLGSNSVSSNDIIRTAFVIPSTGLVPTNDVAGLDKITNQPPALDKPSVEIPILEKTTNLEDTADQPHRTDVTDRRPLRIPPQYRRPTWMSPEEWQSLMAKQGLHSFVIRMSAKPVETASLQDLQLRGIIGFLSTLSVVGAGFAWRNTKRSADLGLRLVKASEMNMHLKQMNLAAAGLAHETRNPLNIVRGLAQIISKESTASDEIKSKSQAIMMEADRVTAQLNEFINYSRPREVRQSPVAVSRVVQDVVQTLLYDAQEKQIVIEHQQTELLIQADEQLLRQALFNLTLNAIQAVEPGGMIEIKIIHPPGPEALLEIRDSGPGISEEHRLDVFKPYFTTHAKGTGLGLAIVQQIVLAHGWEISCSGNEPRGACFTIRHLRVVS
ncbi:MAG: putative Histidine kinase [Verrucomicrobiales bacterium]|nr:putative Histidine kinase [Verrucomicrobiales bacterium]